MTSHRRQSVGIEPLNILIVDHHIGVSGGQNSILRLIASANQSRFRFIVAYPHENTAFAEALSAAGATLCPIRVNLPNSDTAAEGSIYRRPFLFCRYIPTILQSIRQLRRITKMHDIHIFYGNSIKGSALLSCVSGKARRPLVVRLRTSRAFSSHGWIDRFICNRADLLLGNSWYVADTYRDVIRDPGKLRVVYNYGGISEEFRARKHEFCHRLRQELGLPPGGIVIGQVGRLTPRKRIMDVIHALPQLKSLSNSFKCLFIGDYDSTPTSRSIYEEAIELASRLDLADSIVFCGLRIDALQLISALNVLILASEDEPMARVIIEALGVGTPIVASDHGGNAEIIRHRVNGMTYSLGDSEALGQALIELLQDPAFSRRLANQGYSTYQDNFSETVTVKKEFDAIEQLAARWTSRS